MTEQAFICRTWEKNEEVNTLEIRLETSKRRRIENEQDTEICGYSINWYRRLAKRHPNAKQRTDISAVYNCHGLTFASRRTRIIGRAIIDRIIEDDKYREIELQDVMPGDIVVYYSDDGDPNHSGIVVTPKIQINVPWVCSKWGGGGEFIHSIDDHPKTYGPNKIFFRCTLWYTSLEQSSSVLRIWEL